MVGNSSLNKEAEFSLETLVRIYQNVGHNILEDRMSQDEIKGGPSLFMDIMRYKATRVTFPEERKP